MRRDAGGVPVEKLFAAHLRCNTCVRLALANPREALVVDGDYLCDVRRVATGVGYTVGSRDDFGAGYTKHKADTDLGGTDDITITGGSEIDEKTTLEFSIPLHSWDSNDRKLEQGEEYKLIFAYGKKDDFESYHKTRTSLKVTL